MKKYYKLFIVLILFSLIIPQIALAAWWNPLSWFNNWSFLNFFKKDNQVQVVNAPDKEVENETKN